MNPQYYLYTEGGGFRPHIVDNQEDVEICGNQSDQKKFIGNSVVPHVVTAWCETMVRKNRELIKQVA